MSKPERVALARYDAVNKTEREMLGTLLSHEWIQFRQVNFLKKISTLQRKQVGQISQLTACVEVKKNTTHWYTYFLPYYFTFSLQSLVGHVNKIHEHLKINPLLDTVAATDLQTQINEFKQFQNNKEIRSYFHKDEGLRLRLETLDYYILYVAKQPLMSMSRFSRRLVAELFTADFVMTHAWQVATGSGER